MGAFSLTGAVPHAEGWRETVTREGSAGRESRGRADRRAEAQRLRDRSAAHSHGASGNAEGLAGHRETVGWEVGVGLGVVVKAGKWMCADAFDVNINVKRAAGREIALPQPELREE